MKWKQMTAAILGAVMLAGSSLAAQAEETETEPIRIGSILALGTAAPFAARELGYYEEAGLEVEIAEFADGSALMEAFAAGELDIAMVGIGPAATWFMKGIDLKVVAGSNGGGHVLMTRQDTGIETVADLQNALVAEPNIATVTDALLRAQILQEAGLDPDLDVVLVPGMKPADMATLLFATKEVDAMITWEPYASQAEAEYGEDVKILYDAASELAAEDGSFYPGNVVIASGSFIEEQEELLDTFLEVHQKTTEYLNTDQGANELLASLLMLEPSVIENARNRIDFHWEINQEESMKVLQWSADLGYLDGLPDAEQFFLE